MSSPQRILAVYAKSFSLPPLAERCYSPETRIHDNVRWLEIAASGDERQFISTVWQRSRDGAARRVRPVENPATTT